MFKKIASIALAAALVGSTAVIAASAADAEEAVAAAEDSAVAAADDSAVGAEEENDATGASGKIYFEVPSTWKNFKAATFYLYQHGDGGGEIIAWGSKKGKMTDEGNGVWSFDITGKGYSLESGKAYGCIFTGDWGIQTCDLIISADNYGDTAFCDGTKVENNVDSNKQSDHVAWKSGKNGVPLCITSIGNIVGDSYWPGEDAKTLMTTFLTTILITFIEKISFFITIISYFTYIIRINT